MEYTSIVINEQNPRILVKRPILTPEQLEERRKEISAELSKIYWYDRTLTEKRKQEGEAV